MANTYITFKKIHRFIALFALALGLAQVTTGLLLKFPQFTRDVLSFIDLSSVRSLHNAVSVYFSLVFFAMMITGTWMFFYTRWLKRKSKAAVAPPTENQS